MTKAEVRQILAVALATSMPDELAAKFSEEEPEDLKEIVVGISVGLWAGMVSALREAGKA